MDEPLILKDPDTEETYVSCPHCERITSMLDMVTDMGCACRELVVFVDKNTIIMIPTNSCPTA